MNLEKLKFEIANAFRDVEFPAHCGILAAVEIDNWIDDESELERITAEKDFRGAWRDVPIKDIRGNSLAFNYLDGKGFRFYLPALMTLAIDEPSQENIMCVVDVLNPGAGEGEASCSQHFKNQIALFENEQLRVCYKFLKASEPIVKANPYLIESVEDVVNSPFWNSISKSKGSPSAPS